MPACFYGARIRSGATLNLEQNLGQTLSQKYFLFQGRYWIMQIIRIIMRQKKKANRKDGRKKYCTLINEDIDLRCCSVEI